MFAFCEFLLLETLTWEKMWGWWHVQVGEHVSYMFTVR
jgi:hypothetical protein